MNDLNVNEKKKWFKYGVKKGFEYGEKISWFKNMDESYF